MSVVPGSVDTDQQPPMMVPLRHFVVAFGFLLIGILLTIGTVVGVVSGLSVPAHAHLLLVGWICLTIMGAMTQFVPVWGGVSLYSRRLATIQLWLVVVGVLGVAALFLSGQLRWLPIAGSVLVVGLWTFVYNMSRTLARIETHDVTTIHFAAGVGFFFIVSILGLVLVADHAWMILSHYGLARAAVIEMHATVAVFGAILTTIIGALYQLVPMFTQAESHRVDGLFRRLTTGCYPSGVVLLGVGRLISSVPVARIGGVLVVSSLFTLSLFLTRQLVARRTSSGPLMIRYAVVAGAIGLWSVVTLLTWVRTPLRTAVRFGGSGTAHLLLFGVIGFVVLGTLYHIVPFIVWVHRYSDQLGLQAVPMVDDLYSDRLAQLDFVGFFGGFVLLVMAEWLDGSTLVLTIAGGMTFGGAIAFSYNLLALVRQHSPDSMRSLLFGTAAATQTTTDGGQYPDDSRTEP